MLFKVATDFEHEFPNLMSVSLYVAFWHLIEPFYYYLLSFLSFQFSAHRTDHRSHRQAVITCRLTRKPVHQIHLESDHHTRSSDPTLDQATRPETIVRPDHKIRPSDQDARLPDHRPWTTGHRRPSLSTQLPISAAYPTSWNVTG